MKRGRWMIAGLLMCLLASCEKVDFSVVEDQDKKGDLIVYTRASEDDKLQYPLVVYAFDAKGQCRGQQTLSDEGATFSFQLSSGSYRIVALGGIASCDLPSSPRLSSVLSLKENASVPLQMGQADVVMGQGGTKAYLQMRYLVSQVQVSLSGLPNDVTSVTMVLSKPYSQWAFSGSGNAPVSYTKALKQGELPGEWASGKVYVLPTEGAATLTLNLTTSAGNVSYAYTCPEALQSGTPYMLRGSYSTGDMVVEGEFSVEGWSDVVNWDFGFGPGTPEPDVDEPSGAPEVGSLWQNHIVAYVSELNESQWSVYLLSREEKTEVPSGLSEKESDFAVNYAQNYVEDGISGWTIPTTAEVNMLLESFGGDALMDLNMMLTQEGLPPFLDYEPNSSTEKARYLCDEGLKSFSLASNSKIWNVSGTKKYRLRLVKEIVVDK